MINPESKLDSRQSIDPDGGESNQVFISYGRADAFDFVKRLSGDLQQRDYRVWVDLENIQSGGGFDVEIEDGIRTSSLIAAILTPGSVREKSVCRKEIIFALNEGKHVVPLRAHRDVKPSLMLADLHWIDFTEGYESALANLLRLLRGDESASRPPLQTTVTGIPPLDFGPEMARYSMDLAGRGWLLRESARWLESGSERMMLLIGEPGIGKSTIATWLSQNQSGILSIHFCTYRNTRSLDPHVFVASLVGRLHSEVPGFAEALAKRDPHRRRPTASDEFRELVVLPAREIAGPSDPRIVIIDSLDEAAARKGETILDVLVQQAEDLPAWLKLISTTRPEEQVLTQIRSLSTHEVVLNPEGAENTEDLRLYLHARFQAPALVARLNSSAEILTKVEKLAAGNFLYAKLVLDALETGSLPLSEVGQLYPGLAALYGRMFRQRFTDSREYLDHYAPLLQVLAAARGPLPYSLLKELIGQNEETVRLRLRDLSVCLRIGREREATTYSLFHRSFADWVTDAEQAGSFFVSVREGEARLAELGWNEFQRGSAQISNYMRTHLAIHLADVDRWDDLLVLLSSAELALLPKWVDGGEIETGLTCLTRLIDYLEKKGSDGVKAAGLSTRLAQLHVQCGAYKEAEHALQYALSRTSLLRGRRERAIALHELGSLHLYRGEYKEANRAYRKALSLCLSYKDEAAANLIGLATVAVENFRFAETLVFARRAARKAKAGKDSHHLIAAKRLIASAHRGLGQYEEAAIQIDVALALCLVADAKLERTRLLAMKGWLLYDLATLRQEEPAAAGVCFREYQTEADLIHNYYGIQEAELSLGWCALVSNNGSVAKDSFRRLRDSLLPDQHFGLCAGNALGLAAVLQLKGDLTAAASAYREVIDYCSAHGVTGWMGKALVGLGATQWHSGCREQAETTWSEALRVVGEISPAKQILIQMSINSCKGRPNITPR